MRAEVRPLVDRAALLREWAYLEPTATTSCFTSTAWLTSWLAALPLATPLFVARATRGDALAALAVFGRNLVSSKLGRHDTLHLNATGDARIDRICVEMNGILVRSDCETEATNAIVEAITGALPSVDRIAMAALRDGAVAENAGRKYGWLVERHAIVAPYVDLAALRHDARQYRDALKKKARYAVRHATQAYTDAFGPTQVIESTNSGEAQTLLEQLARWSRARWGHRETPSAFDEPFFESFHQDLVSTRFGTGLPRLLQVRFGDTCVGIVYVLEHRGWSAFYQCGYDYELLGPRAQPGYAVLPAVVDYLSASGSRAFDFLGDATHYKRMLATHTRELVSLQLMRPTVRNRVELIARRCVARARRFARLRRASELRPAGRQPE